MLQLEKDLRTQVKAMLKEKSARQSKLKSLIQEDQDLCDVLCEDLFPIHPERIPSQQQLEDYRRHVGARNQEKVLVCKYCVLSQRWGLFWETFGHVCLQERRHTEFVEVKRQITALMEDLEQLPDSTFEKDAVCEDEEAFCLSVENISSLDVLLRQVHTNALQWNLLSLV